MSQLIAIESTSSIVMPKSFRQYLIDKIGYFPIECLILFNLSSSQYDSTDPLTISAAEGSIYKLTPSMYVFFTGLCLYKKKLTEFYSIKDPPFTWIVLPVI